VSFIEYSRDGLMNVRVSQYQGCNERYCSKEDPFTYNDVSSGSIEGVYIVNWILCQNLV